METNALSRATNIKEETTYEAGEGDEIEEIVDEAVEQCQKMGRTARQRIRKRERRDKERDINRELDRAIEDVKKERKEQLELQEQEDKWRRHLSMNGRELAEAENGVSANWRLKQTNGDTLLGEDGEELHRKLGLSDGDKREVMVESIKGVVTRRKEPVNMAALVHSDMERMVAEQAADGWYPVNLGRSYVSGKTVYNLFAAVSARRKGLGTYIGIGSDDCYLFDGYGRRFMMKEVGQQLRFKGRLYTSEGRYKEIELVHDSGAAAGIIRSEDAELWEDSGESVVCMGGYTGERAELKGGGELCLMLHSTDMVGLVENQDDLQIATVLELVAEEEEIMEEAKALLVSTRAKEAKARAAMEHGSVKDVKEKEMGGSKEDFTERDVIPNVKSNDTASGVDKAMEGMTAEERQWVLGQVKSAKSLQQVVASRKDKEDKEANHELSCEIGVMKRIAVMKEYCRKYPHLTMAKLNSMVRSGDIADGIELDESARLKDEAVYIAKATKTRVHRSRKSSRENAGKGHRASFFMVELDLIDLTHETKGNRWGYKWLLVCVCKEYGTLKIYPLKGKDDVKTRWRQFKQWIEVIAPYVKAALGVEPRVMIVGSDRGAEFVTTHGRRMGELDHELFKDNIYRYTSTAGDSNAMGKVERANRNIMANVNAMLRQGGARNDMAYYAALMFETHYNTTPTSANVIGDGEAPFKTLGIPFDNSKHVRFFCPAFVKLPKNTDIWSGEPVPQNKLVSRASKCFVVGYGGAFSQGADHDGYKVLLPPRKKGEEAKVYSSKDVAIASEL